jgi:hypothetical protein
MVEDINVKTEAEVVNPSSYQSLNVLLTRLKRKRQLDDQHANPYRHHHWASNITGVPPSFPSTSKKTATKCQRVTSTLTSMPQTPL